MAELPVPVTFRITTYWKRKRGEVGLTQMQSHRLALGEALDWILRELPDEAIEITEGEQVTLRIDWSKVPHPVRAGVHFLSGGRR